MVSFNVVNSKLLTSGVIFGKKSSVLLGIRGVSSRSKFDKEKTGPIPHSAPHRVSIGAVDTRVSDKLKKARNLPECVEAVVQKRRAGKNLNLGDFFVK